jgi:hypothetical protein
MKSYTERSYTSLPAATPARMATELRGRNLGSAIILAAIKDYQSVQACVHESASSFLFPTSPEWRRRYDWAVALAKGLNPSWLRDALDRNKADWDAQRSARLRVTKASRRRRGADTSADEMKRNCGQLMIAS